MSEKMWVPVARIVWPNGFPPSAWAELTSVEKTQVERNAELWEGNSHQVPDIEVLEHGWDNRRRTCYLLNSKEGYLTYLSVVEGGQAFVPIRIVKPKVEKPPVKKPATKLEMLAGIPGMNPGGNWQ